MRYDFCFFPLFIEYTGTTTMRFDSFAPHMLAHPIEYLFLDQLLIQRPYPFPAEMVKCASFIL